VPVLPDRDREPAQYIEDLARTLVPEEPDQAAWLLAGYRQLRERLPDAYVASSAARKSQLRAFRSRRRRCWRSWASPSGRLLFLTQRGAPPSSSQQAGGQYKRQIQLS
jgi:hypothetical protein